MQAGNGLCTSFSFCFLFKISHTASLKCLVSLARGGWAVRIQQSENFRTRQNQNEDNNMDPDYIYFVSFPVYLFIMVTSLPSDTREAEVDILRQISASFRGKSSFPCIGIDAFF